MLATSPRARAALQALFMGMCASLVLWPFYRAFTAKFPLNFVSPVYASVAFLGIPLGLLAARHFPRLSIPLASALGGLLWLFALSALAYKDKSVHYLLFGLYYDYPAPASGWVTRGLVASVPLSVVPMVILARGFELLPKEARSWSAPALAAGIGAGLMGAHLAIPPWGAYAVLVAGCMGVATLLWSVRRVALATLAVTMLTGVAMNDPKEAIFTWQLREYQKVDTYWTPFYKADWIEFDDGHCIGGVRNEIMIGYSCDEAEKLPLTHRRMAAAISNGPIPRKRVASIGRPDGVIAMAHQAYNPKLERFIAVENDPRIVADMKEKYTSHQGGVFTEDPRFELLAADNRLFLEHTDEKLDALYIDGIGLMLVPYPFTIIQHENYLFSADAYRRIFNEILTKDGVLIIDRGTTSSGEGQDLAGSLPEGVHVRSFYTKIPTYPLTGLPLVYILASRNVAELERIASKLVEGNLYTAAVYDSTVVPNHFVDDDKPMFQPEAISGMQVVMLPFAFATFGFVFWLLRKSVPDAPRKEIRVQLLLGALVAFVVIWFGARGARAFMGGANTGYIFSVSALFLGAALGLAAGNGLSDRLRMLFAALACAAGFGLLLAVPLEPWAALAGSLAGGIGAGAIVSAARATSDAVPDGFELILGAVSGIFVFQWALHLVGFQLLAVLVCLVLALRAVLPRQGQTAPVASPATG